MMSKSKKNLVLIVVIFIICFVVSRFLYQFVLIQGPSMEPAYYDRQLVVIDKFSHKITNNKISQNDVVIVEADTLDILIIKRVAAIPGDTVQILDGVCYVNGIIYTTGVSNVDLGEDVITLNNEYFILGDNYNNSIDSRSNQVGLITEDDIIGRVVFTLY